MKKSELKKIIKEEFKKVVKEGEDVDLGIIDRIATITNQKLIRGRRNPTVVAPIISDLIKKITDSLQYDTNEFKQLFLLLRKQNKL